jgi:fructokinase
MSRSELPIVIGLGELLWDCFAESRLPGGAPANVAFHACQLGCRGVVCSRVGRDPLGDELLKFLAGQGLETTLVQRDAAHPTSTVTVDTSRPDQPRFIIHENVAWDYIAFEAPLEQMLAQAAAVCFGTLAQRSPTSRETIQRAIRTVRPGCLVVYDVNLRQHFYDRDWVETSLRASQVVKLNAEEVVELDKLLDLGAGHVGNVPHGGQIEFAKAVQQRFGVHTVCITRGGQGCLLVGPDEVADDPGKPVRVADTVGAGDAFTAGLIAARLHGWSLEAQASFGNAVGALVASRSGAMPVLREEELGRLLMGYDAR